MIKKTNDFEQVLLTWYTLLAGNQTYEIQAVLLLCTEGAQVDLWSQTQGQ